MKDVANSSLLLSKGADPNIPCTPLNMCPLHVAVRRKDFDNVKLLLKANAKVNIMDNWNFTPLSYTALYPNAVEAMEMFSLLLQHGATPNYGATMSKETGTFEVEGISTDTLGKSYCSVAFGPCSGATLHLAIKNPHLTSDIINLLLEYGADVNKLNLQGQTPLMMGMMDILYNYRCNVKANTQLLLQQGASVDAQDTRGWTSFHYATQCGLISAMSMLMDYNCQCDLHYNRETPLWLALVQSVFRGKETAEFLLCSGGCDINRSIRTSRLLNLSQDIHLCHFGSIYPIEFAMCNHCFEIAELLIDMDCMLDDMAFPSNPHNSQYKRILNKINIKKEMKTPKSLQHLSRMAIRYYLQRNIVSKVKALSLPEQINTYICFAPISRLQPNQTNLLKTTNADTNSQGIMKAGDPEVFHN